MLVVPDSQPTEKRLMRTSIRYLNQSVETLLTISAVNPPRRTRQRLILFSVGILLAARLVLRRMACTLAYLTPRRHAQPAMNGGCGGCGGCSTTRF
jgi:hypothetical protein